MKVVGVVVFYHLFGDGDLYTIHHLTAIVHRTVSCVFADYNRSIYYADLLA